MNLLPQMVRRDRRLRLSGRRRGRRARSRLLAHRADKADALARDRCGSASCCSPLSPTALRTAVMRLLSVDSETMRPPQTAAMISSLVTTRSRFSNQIDKEIKDLRLDLNQSRAAPQLAAADVERIVAENELHGCPASGYPPALTE